MALRRLAQCCRSSLRGASRGVLCAATHSGWLEHRIGAKRHLLSEDVIRLQEFQQKKVMMAHLVTGSTESFVDLVSQKMQRNELLLQEELKLLLHLCHSAEDMMVARDAIYRYHTENRNFAYGEFKFGPLFMRLCYEMGLEEMAAAALTDKNMAGFFNDSTSFNIAIDMLFMKGCYKEALGLLKIMKNQGLTFNKDTMILASGTCYKLNTAESFHICTALIEDVQTKGYFLPRRALCFAVGLALRQNDPEKAQLLYSQIMTTECRLCQNLKILILAMSGATAEAITFLSSATLKLKSPLFVKRPEISQEVVNLLVSQNQRGPHTMKVEQVVSQLEQAGQVTQETLDDMLCYTPSGKRRAFSFMEDRKTSRRTHRPLTTNLLSE